MKKYKLIKLYPDSPKLGTVITKDKKVYGVLYHNETMSFISPDRIIENSPEFWEEIVEKEYIILSLKDLKDSKIYSLKYNGNYSAYDKDGTLTLQQCLDYKNIIYSIKRNSDGEIFTIGDKVRIIKLEYDGSFIIDEFYFDCNNDKLLCNGKCTGNGHVSITKIEKCKLPLFKTKDGINIFEGDEYYPIGFCKEMPGSCEWYIVKDEHKHLFKNSNYIFSTKEKAEDYIFKNKPCLNFNDVINYYNKWYGTFTKDNFHDGLKKLVQTKL